MNFSSVHNVHIFGPAYLLYVCTHILVICTRTCTPYLLIILPYITCLLKSHPFRFSQFPQFFCTTIPNSYNHKPNPHHNYTYFQSSSSHTGSSYEPQPFICTLFMFRLSYTTFEMKLSCILFCCNFYPEQHKNFIFFMLGCLKY